MKIKQLKNISDFADKFPITEENIIYFYHYWDINLDKFDVDLNEFVMICNLIKCFSQKENDDICFIVNHLYRMLDYNIITPAFKLLSNCKLYKISNGKIDKELSDEMFEIYKDSFGRRYAHIIAILTDNFEDWNNYKIDID